MRYVIIRDDDTNASTPIECLERLYRPALDRGLPINLATIPEVSLAACTGDGSPEGFLHFKNGDTAPTLPIASNPKLVAYLKENSGYEILQHGLHHDYLEFERLPHNQAALLIERGTQLLLEAGFKRPQTFVAPYDKFNSGALREVARRFPIISCGWYELRRLPPTWWPRYVLKKMRRSSHWRVGHTLLLSHPGCLLSCFRDRNSARDLILQNIQSNLLTVLVTHWWEYFRNGSPNELFIDFLHETLDHLASIPQIEVLRFSDLLHQPVPLN